MRIPTRQGSPVLTSVIPVIEASNHVRTDETRLIDVASWLAYEELPMPQFLLPFKPRGDRGDRIGCGVGHVRASCDNHERKKGRT